MSTRRTAKPSMKNFAKTRRKMFAQRSTRRCALQRITNQPMDPPRKTVKKFPRRSAKLKQKRNARLCQKKFVRQRKCQNVSQPNKKSVNEYRLKSVNMFLSLFHTGKP